MNNYEFYYEPLLPCDSVSVRSHIAPFPDERQEAFQYLHQMCYRDWEDIGYMMKMEDENIEFFLNKIGPQECLHMVEFSGKLEYIMRMVRQMDVLLNASYYFITASFCFQEDNRDKLVEMIDVINSFTHDCGSFTSLRYEKSIAPGDAFIGLYFIANVAPQRKEGRVVSVSVNTHAFSTENANTVTGEGNLSETCQHLKEDSKRQAGRQIGIRPKRKFALSQGKDKTDSGRPSSVNRCSFCQKDASAVGKLFFSNLDGKPVFICDECVRLCNAILEESKANIVTPDINEDEAR